MNCKETAVGLFDRRLFCDIITENGSCLGYTKEKTKVGMKYGKDL